MEPVYYRNSASRSVVIKSLAEAETALRTNRWKKTATYSKARHTVRQAIAGNYTPNSALAAFVALIKESFFLALRERTCRPSTDSFRISAECTDYASPLSGKCVGD